MSTVKLLSIFAENKPGQTARLTKIIADAGVNICWTTIENTGSFGVMKVLVDKCDLAYEQLKSKGVMVSLLEVLAAEVSNKPGSFHGIVDCLACHKVNLDNCSGFISNQRAILIIQVSDLAQAESVLLKQGIRLLGQEEMLKL